jgi:hypothetical protein
VKIDSAVNERPMAFHIVGEIANRRRHQFDKSDVCRDRPSVPFKPSFAACNGQKLMAAA